LTEQPLNLDDFTERGYVAALTAAVAAYSFKPFGTDAAERHVLWRHDVDVSMHRAVRLAEIEVEHGARSTWFVSLHSAFYNLLERDVTERAARLAELGHWIGLHFDAFYYAPNDDLEERMAFERSVLEQLIEAPVGAVSFHNPDLSHAESLRDDVLAGMVNAYGRTLRERYAYVSDSNGYWRFRRLADVLEAAEEPRLHVLIHPEWWQREAMMPRERIQRAIDGRAHRVGEAYDELLAGAGRFNARSTSDA
jgi:hypothetical protein